MRSIPPLEPALTVTATRCRTLASVLARRYWSRSRLSAIE